MKIRETLAAAAVALTLTTISCGGPRPAESHDTIASAPAPWDLIDENGNGPMPAVEPLKEPEENADVISMAPDSAIMPTELKDTLPARVNMGRYNRIGRLADVFNDSNKYQYAAGERIGIRPIRSLADAYYLRRPLVEISSNQWYDLDTLTHSMPYLVPEAAKLLEDIGRNFADSLARRNASEHKFRVTSVLRTAHSVKRLRRVNRNATDSSTHQLGTTFDISYAKFNYNGTGRQLSDEEMKYILAEVLYDLRAQHRCMVKFERKSPCFHITATGL